MQVVRYLRRLSALRQPSSGQQRAGDAAGDGGDDGGSSGGDDESEGGGRRAGAGAGREGDPCPDCGRTYPHTHVKAVFRGGAAEGDEDSDFGDL